mmetsp:Transcript_88613/g.225570  ORF Transcript_88613/g.225570 Transcript_88613/m.225570 type:complete len:321 (-) Transcript_88613:405-1367(-)
MMLDWEVVGFGTVHGGVVQVHRHVHTTVHLSVRVEVQRVGHQPHGAQRQKHAQVRWQPCPDLQDGHQEDQHDAESEDDHLQRRHILPRSKCQVSPLHHHFGLPLRVMLLLVLPAVAVLVRRPVRLIRATPTPDHRQRDAAPAAEAAVARGANVQGGRPQITRPPHPDQRQQSSRQRRKDEPLRRHGGSDLPLYPEHGGRHIANWTPSTTCICCEDDHATTKSAMLLVISGQVFEDFQRHNGGCEVVDHRAKEEGEHADDRHEALDAAIHRLPDDNSNQSEAAEVVDGLNDSHSRQEEEDHAADILQASIQLLMQSVGAGL